MKEKRLFGIFFKFYSLYKKTVCFIVNKGISLKRPACLQDGSSDPVIGYGLGFFFIWFVLHYFDFILIWTLILF